MKKWTEEKRVVEILRSVICDKCGEELTDPMDTQEAHLIQFTGGYSSVFGDMNEVECDLCQKCLRELIGPYCFINGQRLVEP